MDVACPKRPFPVFGTALAGVSQLFRTRRHPLLELPGEAVQRILGHAEGFEAMVGERNTHPGIGHGTRWVCCGGHDLGHSPHQLPTCVAVVNPKHYVSCDVGSWTRTQYSALDVIQLKPDVSFWSHRSSLCWTASFQ